MDLKDKDIPVTRASLSALEMIANQAFKDASSRDISDKNGVSMNLAVFFTSSKPSPHQI